jgi:hypothetical protein
MPNESSAALLGLSNPKGGDAGKEHDLSIQTVTSLRGLLNYQNWDLAGKSQKSAFFPETRILNQN